MPAHDLIHDAVKNALIKDGWTITAEPFALSYGEVVLYVELAAEREIADARVGNKIAVEINRMAGSEIQDLEFPLGQFLIRRDFLRLVEPDRKIFIGVSDSPYNDFFSRKAVQYVVRETNLALVIVNIEREEIVKWINTTDTAI